MYDHLNDHTHDHTNDSFYDHINEHLNDHLNDHISDNLDGNLTDRTVLVYVLLSVLCYRERSATVSLAGVNAIGPGTQLPGRWGENWGATRDTSGARTGRELGAVHI